MRSQTEQETDEIHQKIAPAVRHSKHRTMLKEWQAVEVLTLGRLGTGSSTTWSSTGCHRSRPCLPSHLSRVAKLPPHRKVGTLKARCGPASLRAAGQQSPSSFLAESSARPKAWARIKEALSLSLCRFAPNRVKEEPGRATGGRAFAFSLLSAKNKEAAWGTKRVDRQERG